MTLDKIAISKQKDFFLSHPLRQCFNIYEAKDKPFNGFGFYCFAVGIANDAVAWEVVSFLDRIFGKTHNVCTKTGNFYLMLPEENGGAVIVTDYQLRFLVITFDHNGKIFFQAQSEYRFNNHWVKVGEPKKRWYCNLFYKWTMGVKK